MKLFEMRNYDLQVSEEAWGYKPFKKILSRDKSKHKEKAFAEILFIWSYCDIKSDYMFITDLEERKNEIIHDIGLPKNWKVDKDIQEAIDFYNKFISTVEKLYRDTLQAANDIGNYLSKTEELLAERDVNGKPIVDISKITTALGKMPKLMSDLKAAYKEVVTEKQDSQGKSSGSKSHNLFEEGLKID